MISRLFAWLPSRRRLERERAAAAAEVADAARHQTDSQDTIREAYMVAHKLAAHRQNNHFSQRMRAAYRGGGE